MRLRICLLLVSAALTLTCRAAWADVGPVSNRPGETGAPAPDHAVVLGFDRFLAGGKDAGSRGGQLLLGELNCLSCHQAPAGAEQGFLKKQAPVLDGIGGRVRASYLKAFLSDPQTAKPGTAMP